MLNRRSRSLLLRMPLSPMCEIAAAAFFRFGSGLQWCVSWESAGRCFCHSSICVIVFVVSVCCGYNFAAMYCAAFRRTHTHTRARLCGQYRCDSSVSSMLQTAQRWCERNRARVKVSHRLPWMLWEIVAFSSRHINCETHTVTHEHQQSTMLAKKP